MSFGRGRGLSIFASVSALCLIGLLTGCETVTQTDRTQYPLAVSVYEIGCNTCHGQNLQGGIGPSLQHVGATMTVAQIVHQIEVGGGPMPAYAAPHDEILTQTQILAVARWLATKR
ncbi:MAG: cytochrome c [Firmicutes bacterium]|nr:cytochrome c [Bacillota bacterium]